MKCLPSAVSILMPVWVPHLPGAVRGPLVTAMPAMLFALGFMTTDTLIATGIGWRLSGRAGIRFWERELPPTFARYNVMAVTGTALVALYAALGLAGFLLGVGWLLTSAGLLRARQLDRVPLP